MWRTFAVLALVALALVIALPATAQGVVWNAQYFNNAFLNGTPALTRQDTAVSFNWGVGSPGSGVNVDGFTARWGTDVNLPAGTYRFWALADDSVRVNVDYQFTPLIDTFPQPRVGQTLSGDIALNAGVHHIQVDYSEAGGDAYVFVTWADLATNPSGPNFSAPPTGSSGQSSGPWTAQYYSNTGLSGSPTLIQSESSPTHDFGTGSPVASIPADNFSARWTSIQTLEGGTYQVSVRADDGVRVAIDGNLVINEWHSATGQTYTVNVNLGAGQHNFMVEFYEGGGAAFLNYSFTRVGGSAPPPVTGAAITVTGAFRLNVRAAPDPVNGTVLTRINRNETYSIVGRNSDSSWWQINVNGVVGWVSARYVSAVNTQNVPVTSGGVVVPTATPSVTGASATVTGAFRLNVRNAPDPINGAVLTRINRNETYSIVGRNSNSSWWQINVNGTIGWVNARYVTVFNTQNVPVTSTTVPSSPSQPVVQCPGFLPSRLVAGRQGRNLAGGSANNIRSQPGLNGLVVGLIPPTGVFSVISGPQCSSGIAWWQVNYNGIIGWTAEGQGSDYWLEPL